MTTATPEEQVEHLQGTLRCPMCQSLNTAKVPASEGRWQLGHRYCKDCDHQAYWGEFCEPPVRIVTVGDKMDTEAGVVIDKEGKPFFWHLPDGRSVASLPDSRTLWDVLWTCRDSIQGVAHTHPFNASPYPSHEDVTTFAAIETALGRRLSWWIVSPREVAKAHWVGPDRLDYEVWLLHPLCAEPVWVDDLREVSRQERALGECRAMVGGPPAE